MTTIAITPADLYVIVKARFACIIRIIEGFQVEV